MCAKTPLTPSERAVLAFQRRIETIREQRGEQRATEVAAGALMMIDYWASRPKPRRQKRKP